MAQEIFDPDGDLILILSSRLKTLESDQKPDINTLAKQQNPTEITHPDSISEVGMVVSSKHMMLASPVFKAMLQRGTFKEGHMLQSNGKVEVPLPDDDAASFRIVLSIIHGRNRSVPRTIDLDSMVKVAALVDKYQMVEAVEAYSGSWIESLKSEIPTNYCGAVGRWICICWVFELVDEFSDMTRLVLLQSETATLPDEFMNYVPLPEALYVDLNQLRIAAISELFAVVDQLIKSYLGPGINCTSVEVKGASCDAMILGHLFKSATSYGIYPPQEPPYENWSFETLAYKIQDLKIEGLCTKPPSSRRSYQTYKGAHGEEARITESISLVTRQRVCGLTIEKYKGKNKETRQVDSLDPQS